MRMPPPINWLRGVSCPYLVFEMDLMGWPKERNEREQIMRGKYVATNSY